MSKLDADLICEGFAAALLQPFDFDFYKKLGYEVFSKRRTAVINEKAIEQAYSELKLTGSEQNKSISFTRPGCGADKHRLQYVFRTAKRRFAAQHRTV